MTDFSSVTHARCPICKKGYLREEGPLCDCIQEYCDHEWEFETHIVTDYSVGEFVRMPVICSKCYKSVFHLYKFAEEE